MILKGKTAATFSLDPWATHSFDQTIFEKLKSYTWGTGRKNIERIGTKPNFETSERFTNADEKLTHDFL